MKKLNLKTTLLLVGMMGTLTIGLVNANNEFIVHDTTSGTITVYSQDKSYGITIQDKNLGAENIGDTGYYFQWGNNHGNLGNSDTVNTLLPTDDLSNWANKGYNGSVTQFIQKSNGYEYEDYRNGLTNYDETGAIQHSLWGGAGDNESISGIVKGYDTVNHVATNVVGRQGPCDMGYHVPSAGEWQELAMLRCNANPEICSGSVIKTQNEWANYLSSNGIGAVFSDDLQLPVGGERYYFFGSIDDESSAYYWSSSPHGGTNPQKSWYLYFNQDRIEPSRYIARAYGHSVRCFKNEYVKPSYSLTFDGQGGSEVNTGIAEENTSWDRPDDPTKSGYIFVDWYTSTGYDAVFDFTGIKATGDLTVYAKWGCGTGYKDNGTECVINKDIVIEATATEADQTIKINKYFNNAYTVDRGDGTTGNLTADTTHTYTGAGTYLITLSTSANRWTFQNINKPLVPTNGTTVAGVKIRYMPSLASGFGNNATVPGNDFFYAFNYQGAITGLPEGSFDTSNIITVGYRFFSRFNQNGKLINLPIGSFNISNIRSVENNFFDCFNSNGKLTDLPTGSFRFSSGLTIAKDEFFAYFNNKGALTSLPTGSFNTSYIAVAQSDFFYSFNYNGALISLPNNSFDISNITKTRSMFFSRFNAGGKITSLPAGSFRFSSGLENVGAYFFEEFNSNGKLTSLPTGSFNTSNITGIQQYFFARFNAGGQLTSLPTGSFNTSNIINVKNGGGSFDDFNCGGQIRTLPDSFTLNSILVVSGGYSHSFDSSSYTLNKRVSDLASGITAPSTDKNTFSDNQPGRCGVHPNWLVNPTNACNVKYDANGGTGTTTGGYNSDTTGVVPGLNITSPTREWYTLSGWNDASGNKIDEILFPAMDGQTLYANWMPIEYEINYELNDGVLSGNNATGYTIESETITLINPTKTGYTFTGRSGTNLDSLTTSVTIPTGSTGDREYEANWQINQYTITFKDGDNEITSITADYGTGITLPPNPTKNGYTFKGRDKPVPSTMPAEHMTISAKWERNGSSGGGGGGGGGGGSSKTDTGSASSQTGSQIDSNTGSTTSGTNEKGPETTTGNKAEIETGSQQPLSPTDSSPDREQTVTPLIGGDGEARGGGTQTYTQEFQEAYEFARGNGITTMPTIQKANMEGKLTRIAMAKMLSQYAINVLGKTPDTTQNNKFNDVTDKLDSDYDDGVTLAYQLGIMGQNMPGNSFRPNDEVTRAEFATALSRMAYNTLDGEYKATSKYYVHHMEKLVKEGIITNDDPNMKELRGYVMIMLMRSAK